MKFRHRYKLRSFAALILLYNLVWSFFFFCPLNLSLANMFAKFIIYRSHACSLLSSNIWHQKWNMNPTFPLFFTKYLQFVYVGFVVAFDHVKLLCVITNEWSLGFWWQYYRDNWEDGNPASWGTSPQYQVRNLACLAPINHGNYSIFLSIWEITYCSCPPFSSQEALPPEYMKLQHLVQAGLALLVVLTVKLERQGIAVLPMVLYLFSFVLWYEFVISLL